MTEIFYRYDHADERFQVDLVRDCLAGEKRVKDAGELYLPKLEGMSVSAYKGFRARAPFLSVPRNTLDLAMGKIFRKETLFEGLDFMQGRLPFVDHGRYDMQWGARRAMREVFSVGRVGFLLDLDSSLPEPLNRQVNIVVLKNEDILEVRKFGSTLVEAHLSLDDCDADEYWRAYLNEDGLYAIEKIGKDGAIVGDTVVPQTSNGPLRFIPLTVINPRDFDPACPIVPPMADLAHKTVYHYQLAAEYRQGLHYTATPQPCVTGFRSDEVPSVISPSKIWAAQNPGARAWFLEFSGAGLGELRAALEMTERQLGSMGASLLLPKVTGVQAARTLEIKDQNESSFAVEVAENVSDGLERVFQQLIAWERPANAGDVSVGINTDVVSAKIDAATLTALHRMVLSGHLSWDTWIENLKRGEFVPAERSAEDEKDMIEDGGLPDDVTSP